MAKQLPRRTIVVLLLLTILVSVLGTVTVLNYTKTHTKDLNMETDKNKLVKEPVQPGKFNDASNGQISLVVIAPEQP